MTFCYLADEGAGKKVEEEGRREGEGERKEGEDRKEGGMERGREGEWEGRPTDSRTQGPSNWHSKSSHQIKCCPPRPSIHCTVF